MKAQLDRIVADFGHAGKLGPNSTTRLFTLLSEMIQRIEKIERTQERK